MSPKHWSDRPGTYLGGAVAVALTSLAMCSGEKKQEPVKAKQVVVETDADTELRPEVDLFEKALREVLTRSEEEPTVNLSDKKSLFAVEEGLAECVQMADNTCYLSYDFRLLFRTRLDCYSNSWGKFARPLSFEIRPDPGVGVSINMQLPEGGYSNYESAPSMANREEAEEFYTQLCRDAITVLTQKPDETPCEYPQNYSQCRRMEDNEELAATLSDELELGYESLVAQGFNVELTPANTLRTTFENMDGSTESETLFPKPEHCPDDEGSYEGQTCWMFESMSGGKYTADKILDYAVDRQLRMYEEE